MLDHLTLFVRSLPDSRAFYSAALAPLGYALVEENTKTCAFGPPGEPRFWIAEAASVQSLHLAFAAPSRAAVDAFHRAALNAGATDNGAPGLRPEYHPDYYGAFALDPDGHNIEAVIHAPADGAPG